MNEGRMKSKNSLAIAFAVAAVAIVIVAVLAQAMKDADVAVETDTQGTETGGTTAHAYQDGTYSEDGSYTSPAGQEEIGVTLTLANGVVTAAEVVARAENPGSVMFQGIFVDNFKEFVVGKSIDDLKLDKVSGSSLTPKGFNAALEKIKLEAAM